MAEISTTYEIGEGLKIENGVLSVDTTNAVELNNNHPLTSNGASIELGDLDTLLDTI